MTHLEGVQPPPALEAAEVLQECQAAAAADCCALCEGDTSCEYFDYCGRPEGESEGRALGPQGGSWAGA